MGDGEFIDEEPGPTWTVLVDNVPVALYGFAESSPGVYDLWGVGTEELRGHGVALVKHVREILVLAFELLEVHRIQTTCRTDRPEYVRFIELFGFQREGVMRQLAPDRSDLIIFSKVKD